MPLPATVKVCVTSADPDVSSVGGQPVRGSVVNMTRARSDAAASGVAPGGPGCPGAPEGPAGPMGPCAPTEPAGPSPPGSPGVPLPCPAHDRQNNVKYSFRMVPLLLEGDVARTRRSR